MGKSFSNFVIPAHDKKQIEIIMLGLGGAGKTTLLYKLKGEEVVTIPTIGFNQETVEHKDICFTITDVGGGDKMRRLWRNYYSINKKGVMFIVDSTDREQIESATMALHNLLSWNESKNVVLLVYANKQDLPNAMTPSEIADKLQLYQLGQKRWFVQVASATQGQGLYEGLNWLSNVLTIIPQY